MRRHAPSFLSPLRGLVDQICFALALAFTLLGFALLPAGAAGAPATLWQVPEAGPSSGTGASEIENPQGVATDPTTGHVYVADGGNARIDEFTAWGQFVEAFGWKVDADAPEEKLQVCTAASGCLAGSTGGGDGQFVLPMGVAVGAGGAVYVVDKQNNRAEKFDAEGHFVVMFGGKVNRTKVEGAAPEAEQNRCPVDPGDVCQAGVSGTGNGQFSNLSFTPAIAVGPDGTVYVGDENRIQEFNGEGVYKGQIGLPAEGEVKGGTKEGEGMTESLAVDSAGNLYFDFHQPGLTFERVEHPNIYKHTAAGWSLLAEIEFPLALATDSTGNVYAVRPSSLRDWIVEFGPSGEKLIPSREEEKEEENEEIQFQHFGEVEQSLGSDYSIHGLATGSACGIAGEDVYASYYESGVARSLLRAYGPNPDPELCPPPPRPPSIGDQYATSVDSSAAVLTAKINPHFWPDTTYRVEYGIAPCAEGGCAMTAGVGSRLESKANLEVTSNGVLLSGLSPGTTYHYRFVAESSGGGPVKGVGGEVGKDGAEASFTTPGQALPLTTDCDNGVFRTGSAAKLADCRAYELVSPLDKNGSDVTALDDITGYRAGLDRSSVSGEKLTYSTYGSFGDAASAPYTSQYMASRDPGTGWSSTPISPPRGRSLNGAGVGNEVEFRAFSPDLCRGWLRLDFEAEPVLDPSAVKGLPNLYRADLCGTSGDEALTTVEPSNPTTAEYKGLELQGVSADGDHAIFLVPGNLTPDTAALGANARLYAVSGGMPHYVCILPDGTPSASQCGAGDSGNTSQHAGVARNSNMTGAISADGTRVFWTAGGEPSGGELYLRKNPEQPQSAMSGTKCTEKEKACTVSISAKVIAGAARFWMAAVDGSRMIFTTTSGGLYEYVVAKNKVTLIAEKVSGVLGASEDATRVYFASSEALAPGAVSGQPNLYYHEAGQTASSFVAMLSSTEVHGELNAISPDPSQHLARVSPDGLHAVFMSSSKSLGESVAGYDNTDQSTGAPDFEVYGYDATADAGAGKLVCVSCNPTGARPVGRRINEEVLKIHASGWIPAWEDDLYASRALSDDGSRVFFQSFEALVSRDTNGKQDVYEWEAASSQSACEEKGAELYVRAADGCLALISSGESSQDSEFLDASPSGSDVFFVTGASLVPQDPGLIDVYDARVDGGFAAPRSRAACEGEACQNPPAPPASLTPASFTFTGGGDLLAPAPAPTVGSVKPKIKAPTRAQRLAKALKACRAKPKPKRRRVACEARARGRYGPKKRASKASHTSKKGGYQR